MVESIVDLVAWGLGYGSNCLLVVFLLASPLRRAAESGATTSSVPGGQTASFKMNAAYHETVIEDCADKRMK